MAICGVVAAVELAWSIVNSGGAVPAAVRRLLLPDPRPTTPLVTTKVGTLCIHGQVCLSSRYSLVLPCVICLEKEEEQLYSVRERGD